MLYLRIVCHTLLTGVHNLHGRITKMSYVFLFILLFVIPLYTQQKIVRADRENTRTLLLSEHEQSGHKKAIPRKTGIAFF